MIFLHWTSSSSTRTTTSFKSFLSSPSLIEKTVVLPNIKCSATSDKDQWSSNLVTIHVFSSLLVWSHLIWNGSCGPKALPCLATVSKFPPRNTLLKRTNEVYQLYLFFYCVVCWTFLNQVYILGLYALLRRVLLNHKIDFDMVFIVIQRIFTKTLYVQ